MTLDLCIPAYNEAPIIEETLRIVAAALEKGGFSGWRITVVDNGSKDGTGAVVQAFPDSRVSLLRIETRGKGAAIRAAAECSSADMFGFIDADLSASPADIPTLAAPVENGSADVAVGSRLLDPKRVSRSFARTLSSRVFNFLRRVVLGGHVIDSQCGLKLMDRLGVDVLVRCHEDTWFLDVEFLARAERAGLRVVEIPIGWNEEHYRGRPSKLSVWRDGFGALKTFWCIRENLRIKKTYG